MDDRWIDGWIYRWIDGWMEECNLHQAVYLDGWVDGRWISIALMNIVYSKAYLHIALYVLKPCFVNRQTHANVVTLRSAHLHGPEGPEGTQPERPAVAEGGLTRLVHSSLGVPSWTLIPVPQRRYWA